MKEFFCPRCGSALDPKTGRCPECRETHSNHGVWIVVVVIVVIAAVGMWLWNSRVEISDSFSSLREDITDFFDPAADTAGDALDDAGFAPLDSAGLDSSDAAQAEALKTAQTLLEEYSYSAFSLQVALEEEGFSTENAEYAVAHCGADWMEEAVYSAKNILAQYYSSRTTMVNDLLSYGFTEEEAAYGADNCDADWMEEAALTAQYFREDSPEATQAEIEAMLLDMGYTEEEAAYGAAAAFAESVDM